MGALLPLLSSRSIAILGASADFTKVNDRILKCLLDNGSFAKTYPVSLKYSEIGGLRCYLAFDALRAAVVALAARGIGRPWHQGHSGI